MNSNKIPNHRNYNLDVLKLILSFLIVVHHTPSMYRDFLHPLTTCAVPVFFMISGYLTFSKSITYERLIKSALRILNIFVISFVLFYIIYAFKHNGLYIPGIKDLFLFVFANNEPVIGHLWYLTAYVYVLIFLAILAKCKKVYYLRYIAPFALFLYIACDLWHIIKDVPQYLTLVYCFRNFFFTGIPFFCLGAFIRIKNIKVSNKLNVPIIICLTVLAIFEYNYLHVNHIADVYFCTPPLAIFILSLFITSTTNKENILSKWGEKYSLYIYIFHPIFANFILKMIWPEPDDLLMILNPFFVFVISLCLSAIYVYSKQRVQSLLVRK